MVNGLPYSTNDEAQALIRLLAAEGKNDNDALYLRVGSPAKRGQARVGNCPHKEGKEEKSVRSQQNTNSDFAGFWPCVVFVVLQEK